MKMLKIVIAAAALALASAQVMAFTPPYHIDGAAYTGKATIQSSGGCSVKETFVGAAITIIFTIFIFCSLISGRWL